MAEDRQLAVVPPPPPDSLAPPRHLHPLSPETLSTVRSVVYNTAVFCAFGKWPWSENAIPSIPGLGRAWMPRADPAPAPRAPQTLVTCRPAPCMICKDVVFVDEIESYLQGANDLPYLVCQINCPDPICVHRECLERNMAKQLKELVVVPCAKCQKAIKYCARWRKVDTSAVGLIRVAITRLVQILFVGYVAKVLLWLGRGTLGAPVVVDRASGTMYFVPFCNDVRSARCLSPLTSVGWLPPDTGHLCLGALALLLWLAFWHWCVVLSWQRLGWHRLRRLWVEYSGC